MEAFHCWGVCLDGAIPRKSSWALSALPCPDACGHRTHACAQIVCAHCHVVAKLCEDKFFLNLLLLSSQEHHKNRNNPSCTRLRTIVIAVASSSVSGDVLTKLFSHLGLQLLLHSVLVKFK